MYVIIDMQIVIDTDFVHMFMIHFHGKFQTLNYNYLLVVMSRLKAIIDFA
jgi:hypothetical protein